MTALQPYKVGWCPGALRPMATGDGLVVRVKPSGGVLDIERADALARLALEFGNGDLDLTARANLQIRGVRDEALIRLVDGLAALGLVDPNPEAEAVRNIVASPLAGLDPAAGFDTRSIVAALECRWVADRALHRLPAKWSMVVDEGGLSLSGVTADLRFEADRDGSFYVGLGADPERAPCTPDTVVEAAVALSRLALTSEPRRMDELVQDVGARAVFAAAGLSALSVGSRQIATRPPTRASEIVGLNTFGNTLCMGVAAAFGSLKTPDFLHLVRTARHLGAAEVRLTPWRVLLVTGLRHGSVDAWGEALAGTDLILCGDDPRLRVAACSGAPACHRGTTPVRDHAHLMARQLGVASQEPIALHVSGCGKGCAHAHAAPWTLVGRDGLYDIVHNGKAGDAPVARALAFQDAAIWLSRNANEGRA